MTSHQRTHHVHNQEHSNGPLLTQKFQQKANESEQLHRTQVGQETSSVYESRFYANLVNTPRQSGTTPVIQRKLMLGPVNDRYEQEADQVAAQVVQQLNSPQPTTTTAVRGVLCRTTKRDTERDQVQMKRMMQQRGDDAGGVVSHSLESMINRARGNGQPLESDLQLQMGQAMGADFTGVKVHTDSQSHLLAQSIQAKAFTTGPDVFFRHGAYQPGTQSGKKLIAHELTHVIQQTSRVRRGPKMTNKDHQADSRKPEELTLKRGKTTQTVIQRDLDQLVASNDDLEPTVHLYSNVAPERAWLLAAIAEAYAGSQVKLRRYITKNLQDEKELRKSSFGISKKEMNLAINTRWNWQDLLDLGYQGPEAQRNGVQRWKKEDILQMKKQLKLLNEAVQELPDYTPRQYVTQPHASKKRTPQRAIDARDVKTEDFAQGKQWISPSIMSFSRQAPTGRYAQRRYRMHITGSGALRDLGNLNEGQKEILVPAGTRFTVTQNYNSKRKKALDGSPIIHIFLQPKTTNDTSENEPFGDES